MEAVPNWRAPSWVTTDVQTAASLPVQFSEAAKRNLRDVFDSQLPLEFYSNYDDAIEAIVQVRVFLFVVVACRHWHTLCNMWKDKTREEDGGVSRDGI